MTDNKNSGTLYSKLSRIHIAFTGTYIAVLLLLAAAAISEII